MTAPLGGAAPVRPPFVRPRTGFGDAYLLGAEMSALGAAMAIGDVRIYPIYSQYAVPLASIGVKVTAGAAGATITPVLYDIDAFGEPRNQLWQGAPALDGSAAANPSAAFAGIIPAGWSWVGALCLVGAPTLTAYNRFGSMDPRGSFYKVNGVAGSPQLPIMTGQAAVPAVFVTGSWANTAPQIGVTT